MLCTCVTIFRNTNNMPHEMNWLPKLSEQECTYSSITCVHVWLFSGTRTTCRIKWMSFQNSRNRSVLIAALLYMCGCFQEYEQHAALIEWASKTLGTGVYSLQHCCTCDIVSGTQNNMPHWMNEPTKLSEQESTYSCIAVHVLLFSGTRTTCHIIATLFYMC